MSQESEQLVAKLLDAMRIRRDDWESDDQYNRIAPDPKLKSEFIGVIERLRGEKIANNLFKRYNTIGSRLGEFYKLVFDATFEDDLKELGYHHLFNHVKKIQQKMNEFIHDNLYFNGRGIFYNPQIFL